MYADDSELIVLCRAVAEYDGYYSPHHRNYGSHAIEAYRDCIEIARESGVALHLAHAHLGFDANRGRAPELMKMIDEARNQKVDITFDSYPYLAGATYLHALLPGWFQGGGRQATLARLVDTSFRPQLRHSIEVTGSDGLQGIPADWSVIVIAGVARDHNRPLVGRSIAEIAQLRAQDPFSVFCDLIIDEEMGTSCLMHIGNEENVRLLMTHPAHTAGSDGILVGDLPHPRGWGTFPRYLAHYVRDLGILTWEEAVRQMTSLPASRLGFGDRGVLRPGAAADIVCIDPTTIRDNATYENPKQVPDGIPFVMVNGRLVVDGNNHTGDLPGRALRRVERESVRQQWR
jgi:N-acyl-D-amino-acid deacylase